MYNVYFLTKVERTQEEAKQSCLNMYYRIKKNYSFLLSISKEDKEYNDNIIKIYDRKIRLVENNFCKRAVWNHQDIKEFKSIYIDGYGLYRLTEFKNLFKVLKFQQNMLFSLDETMKFIKENKFDENNKNNIYFNYSNNWEQKLNDFFIKYPEGIIFIKKYNDLTNFRYAI